MHLLKEVNLPDIFHLLFIPSAGWPPLKFEYSFSIQCANNKLLSSNCLIDGFVALPGLVLVLHDVLLLKLAHSLDLI